MNDITQLSYKSKPRSIRELASKTADLRRQINSEEFDPSETVQQ